MSLISPGKSFDAKINGTPFEIATGSLNFTSTFLIGRDTSKYSLASSVNSVFNPTSEHVIALAAAIYASPNVPRCENSCDRVAEDILHVRRTCMSASIAKDLPRPESPTITRFAKSLNTSDTVKAFKREFETYNASSRNDSSSESDRYTVSWNKI